ncbi:MAG TPA: cytochrome c, partial [Phenylobacterium sp.]
MKRTRTIVWAAAAVGVLALSATAAVSAGNPMEERQATMKQVGQTMKEASALNSAAGYDAAKAKTLMDGVAAAAKKLHGLYPAGSGEDPKSAADPKIWANKADFDKRLSEMGALAAAAGKTTSADTFKP